MKTSQAGINLICEFEGLHTLRKDGLVQAYKCPAGVWTIGYGTTSADAPVNEQSVWTVDRCKAIFSLSLGKYEKGVLSAVKVPINQSQFDALVSFAYNCGIGALVGSTLLKKLNAGDTLGAANEFKKWNKAGGKVLAGLTRRREAEKDLFLSKTPAD